MANLRKGRNWKAALSGLAVCGLAAATLSAAQAQNSQGGGSGAALQWPMGGQNLSNSRNQTQTTITPANVGSLTLQWQFKTGGDVTATPAVAYSSQLGVNVVYFPDFAGNFYAVNGKTGQQIWTQKVQSWTGVTGDYSRDDPVVYANSNGDADGNAGGATEIILGDQAGASATYTGGTLQGPGAYVMAVDAATGNLIWKTHVETFPGAIVTSSPVAYNNVVYVGVAGLEEGTAATPGYPCCISRGSVVALDAWTGKIKWKTYMVPDNHGLTGGYSGGAVWGSTPVVDATRNSLYVGTGNNYSVPASVAACITATPMNKACTDPTDYFDSIAALDLTTGAVKWAGRAMFYDAWNVACLYNAAGVGNCPNPAGPDYDFGGSGPNLLTAGGRQLVGVGEKSGLYYALDPDTGAVVWKTAVGPGSALGGIEWGTASDLVKVYVPIANSYGIPYQLKPSGAKVNSGSWAAIGTVNGLFIWQTATPGACSSANVPAGYAPGCMALGPVSVGGGVVFGGSLDTNPADPTMFALDGKTGKILWTYNPGSTVNAAPAIVGVLGFGLCPSWAWNGKQLPVCVLGSYALIGGTPQSGVAMAASLIK